MASFRAALGSRQHEWLNSELAVVGEGGGIDPGTVGGSMRSSTESGDKSLFKATIVLVCWVGRWRLG